MDVAGLVGHDPRPGQRGKLGKQGLFGRRSRAGVGERFDMAIGIGCLAGHAMRPVKAVGHGPAVGTQRRPAQCTARQ